MATRELTVFKDPQSGNFLDQDTVKRGSIQPIAFPDLEISVQQLLEIPER